MKERVRVTDVMEGKGNQLDTRDLSCDSSCTPGFLGSGAWSLAVSFSEV